MLDVTKKDIRIIGYVMRRTNYGEADRILNIITPSGKMSVIAKGVRREKSKLAGGIEIFTLSDYNIHFGKGDLGIVTGAKMQRHYCEIVKSLDKMELAANIMKKINNISEGSDNPDFFKIVDQSFESIDNNLDLRLVEIWYLLNIKKAAGEEVNFYRDIGGKKLMQEKKYDWDAREMAFFDSPNGEYDADDIKLLRLMISSDLSVIRRIKMNDDMVWRVLRLTRMVV